MLFRTRAPSILGDTHSQNTEQMKIKRPALARAEHQWDVNE